MPRTSQSARQRFFSVSADASIAKASVRHIPQAARAAGDFRISSAGSLPAAVANEAADLIHAPCCMIAGRTTPNGRQFVVSRGLDASTRFDCVSSWSIDGAPLPARLPGAKKRGDRTPARSLLKASTTISLRNLASHSWPGQAGETEVRRNEPLPNGSPEALMLERASCSPRLARTQRACR